jgi:S1-C subfamily serine protease
MRIRLFWAAALIGLLVPCMASASMDALALQQRLIEVFQENRDAIVRVKAAFSEVDTEEETTQVMLRFGTGFFVSKDGIVLVNADRVAGAKRVWVDFKGRSYATETIGHDRVTNVAALKVIDLPDDFSIITLDTSVPKPELGAITFAITSPLDFEPSPVMGIVSGNDKKLGNKVFRTEYIRTTITANAGQGGCPILDINGRFIGMTVSLIPGMEGSFCLPVDALARVRDDLVFSGKVIYSWIGFEVGEKINTDDSHAVYLSKVIENSPAAEAGLLQGDHLVKIAGRPIETVSDVPRATFFIRANQYASIEVSRDGELHEYSVKALPRSEQPLEINASEVSQVESDKTVDYAVHQ